jgi:hypothetical protein
MSREAPLVELTAEKDTNYTGICGDSVTLELSDLLIEIRYTEQNSIAYFKSH